MSSVLAPTGWDLETTTLSPWEKGAKVLLTATAHEAKPDGRVRDYLYIPSVSPIVGHNTWAFDLLWIPDKPRRLAVLNKCHDTMVMHALLRDEGEPNNLDYVARKYLGKGKTWLPPEYNTIADLIQAVIQSGTPLMESALLIEYATNDAVLTRELYPVLEQELLKQDLWKTYKQLQTRFMPALMNMMHRGVRIDDVYLEELSDILAKEAADAELDFRKLTNVAEDFNLGSPKQLAELLYDKLKLPVMLYTKGNQRSTSADALLLLKTEVEKDTGPNLIGKMCDDILATRKATKLLGTFVDPLLLDSGKYRGTDGRVHTTYNLVFNGSYGTATGRLSSSDPNLQNIPSKDKRLKRVFIPNEGNLIAKADYSQIELRVAAVYADCKTMLDAFVEGRDIHTQVACDLMDITYADFIPDSALHTTFRRVAKTINFGVLYGMGFKKLAHTLKLMGIDWDEDKCRHYIAAWYRKYPEIRAWKKQVELELQARGEVRGLLGFPRRWNDPTSFVAKRQAVNTKVQNTAAAITLIALDEMRFILHSDPLLTVHDDIVIEYDPEVWTDNSIEREIRKVMVTHTKQEVQKLWNKEVPLDVDITVGLTSWGG